MNNDDLMTKGCDEYHAQKDMECERDNEDMLNTMVIEDLINDDRER